MTAINAQWRLAHEGFLRLFRSESSGKLILQLV